MMRIKKAAYTCFLFLIFPVWGQGKSLKPPKAWIGISFLDVPPAKVPLSYKHKSPEGAVQIVRVFKGASGEQAGLQPGDFILAVDGKVLNGRKTLLDAVHSKSVGDILELKVGRGEKVFLQKMALSPRPEDIQAITKLIVGSPAPELEGVFYANGTGNLKQNRGKVIVLDFWATWCGPCKMIAPVLEQLYTEFKSQGLVIIGVSSEALSTLKVFQERHPHSYALFHDTGGLTQRKYSAYAYPTLVYIDKSGVIQRIEPGFNSKEHVAKRIRELLEL